YCPDCSAAADLKRKQRYALNRGREKLERKRAEYKSNGIEISKKERKSLVKSLDFSPRLVWYNRVAVPFSWAGSKNHIFTTTRTGHTFLRDESRYYRHL